MDINTRNALIRLATILVAGGAGFILYQLVPDPTVKGASVLLEVAVLGMFEQIIKTQ